MRPAGFSEGGFVAQPGLAKRLSNPALDEPGPGIVTPPKLGRDAGFAAKPGHPLLLRRAALAILKDEDQRHTGQGEHEEAQQVR